MVIKMSKKIFIFLIFMLSGIAVAAGGAQAQQASLTLANSSAILGNANNTAWTLEKDAVFPQVSSLGTAEWLVTATKGATTHNNLSVNGYVEIKNTGSAAATIGNIAVNLQRQKVIAGKNRWVSVSVDVADASAGDAATTANIVATATQEVPAYTTAYTVSGASGTFTENSASGSLKFSDADSNDIWAITPQKTIAPGQTVKLLLIANFDNTILNIPAGGQVRAEVIVSFGNAGARGGSGASAKNIDINGNGTIDPTEANGRSVPTRLTLAVPALQTGNASVTLTDPGVSTHGTVTVITPPGFDNGGIASGVVIGDTTPPSFQVRAPVDGGESGGTVCNTAFLKGDDCKVTLTMGFDNTQPIVDPETGAIIGYQPLTHTFTLFPGVNLNAGSCVDVAANRPNPPPVHLGLGAGDFTTFTQGGWGAKPSGNNPGQLLADNFATVYPSGSVLVGIANSGKWMKFLGANSEVTTGTGQNKITTQVWKDAPYFVEQYLPGGGTAAALSLNLTNPDSSSSGVFGGQVLALQLNVDCSGKVASMQAGFGGLIYHNPGDSLDGQSVSQILTAANTALGGGSLPPGYTFSSLNDLVANLNESFDNGNSITGWAVAHLGH